MRQQPAVQTERSATELAEELHRVLSAVFLMLGRRDHTEALPGDLTLAQLSVLMTLQERGPLRMTALAAYQRVRTPTATVAIRRLERMGLVVRLRDSTDLRAVIIKMTPRGDAMCRDALSTRIGQFAEMLRTLSPPDHATLQIAMAPLERLAIHGDT